MNWPRTLVVGVVAGLLLGLPALVEAQRPGEGTAGGGGGGGGAPVSGAGGVAAGSSGSPGGASPSAGSMGSGSSGGSSSTGGNAGWNGPSSSGAGFPGGASSAARPRDEVFQRPGFADVYGNRAIGRNESAPPSGAEAPWYSRPRGNAPATGTAMLRTDYVNSRPPGGGGGGGNPGWGNGGYYPGYPGYYPGYGWGGNYGWYMYPGSWGTYGWGYPDCGYGAYGMGYFYYNPFGWNYYGNCGYSGMGMYGAYPSAGTDFGGGGAGVGYGQYQSRGGLRLKVKPSHARVYVDGYYAGNVDQFDGSFQKLSLERGTHKIEISAPGYTPLVFEIDITSFDTTSWEGNLEKIVEQIK